jgi:AcrR family transcriptional regulator
MFIYLSAMRIRDDIKQEALFEATVKLVNDIGFAASSVAKIANEANVSPATLYVYYKNKEDLIVSTYISIKRDLSHAILIDHDDTRPIRDIMKRFWFNAFEYIANHPGHFQYSEQFANSPYSALVDKA